MKGMHAHFLHVLIWSWWLVNGLVFEERDCVGVDALG